MLALDVIFNSYICSERALALCVVGVGLGGGQDVCAERLVDSVGEGARDVVTVSCVAGGDSRVSRWRPREVTRARQSMLR